MRQRLGFAGLALTLTLVAGLTAQVVLADDDETADSPPVVAEPETATPPDPPANATGGEEKPAEEPPKSDPTPPAVEESTGPAVENPPVAPASRVATAEFAKLLGEWKDIIKSLRDVKVEFHRSESEEQAEVLRTTFDNLIAKGEKLIPKVRETGVAAYREAPNEDRELTRFLYNIVADDVDHDRYETAFQLAETLLENDCDLPGVVLLAGIAAYGSNRFDKAQEYLQQAKNNNLDSDLGTEKRTQVFGGTVAGNEVRGYLQQSAELQELWATEQELRKQEAEADNLPRVRLTTTKGVIELELFENEAPDTVGNFINLVEKPFYEDIKFHRVLPGFMAQTGCPIGDGTGGPGYKIYDECDKPEHRNHFAGSVSMAKETAPDTGGSQFFICFQPTPHLNGLHTVFGRVIKGMEVLSELNRTENASAEPDEVLKAEVIRKNENKKYVPRKVVE